MAKEKTYLSGKVEIKTTFSRKAEPVDKTKVRSRGPNLLGQQKETKIIRLGHIDVDELNTRMSAAFKVLETGKVPKAVKAAPQKVVDATLSKAKGDLTKANNKLKAEREKVVELEKKVKELEAKIPTATPTEGEEN